MNGNPLDYSGRWWTGQPSINPESEAVKRGATLPVLSIGNIGLCASSSLALLGLWAICGLLFFEGLLDEGAQPGPDVEVPLGAEELETLTGFGRDADMKWNTVQHKTHDNT